MFIPFRKYLLLPSLIFLFHAGFSQTASISGRIINSSSKEGLSGATVSINSTVYNGAADNNGDFKLTGIAPGEYDMLFGYVGYINSTRHVKVKGGETLRFIIALKQSGQNLSEVTVFGMYRKEEEAGSRMREKNAGNVTNIISAQSMVRSPDINAANVIQRMSGITIQRSGGGDEAYSVIRGMEPRYNNTLVNGIKIASPSDKSRFVPLDIIPSDLLSSIEISKSLLPSMEGDAIGGTVNLVVKDAPDTFSLKALGSVGYSQLFIDQKYNSFYQSVIQSKSPIQRNKTGYTSQINDFPGTNLDFMNKQAPPTFSGGITYSQRFLKNKLGIILADNAQNQYFGAIDQLSTVDLIDPYISYKVQKISAANRSYSDRQLNNGLVAHVDYVFNARNRINVNNLLVYNYFSEAFAATDTTLFGDGRTGPGTGTIGIISRSAIQKQMVENLKVSGWHRLRKNLILDWAGVISDAQKKEPDRAEIVSHVKINADHSRSPQTLNYVDRTWQQNDDKDYTGIANLTYHTRLFHRDGEIKAGGLYRTKSRFNQQDYYRLLPINPPFVIDNTSFSSYENALKVKNVSGSYDFDPNNYRAHEKVAAGYLQGKINLNQLEITGGVRVENTDQGYDIPVTAGFVSIVPAHTVIQYLDVLPSIAMKYRITDRENLRLSYFNSISRPNYFELVPSRLPVGNLIQVGNPDLKHATADNLDLRYEIYPKGEEQFFVGVFYKNIQNPIEYALKKDSNTAGVSTAQVVYKPQNFGTAHNYGLEIAFTKYFGRIGFTGNYTYTHSALTSRKFLYDKSPGAPSLPREKGDSLYVLETRPMQGQSDHIINLSLLYKDSGHGFFAQVSYGYIGRTLMEVSNNYGADYYQRPMSTLSFSLEKDLSRHFTVFGKFNNLLNTASVIYSQDLLVEHSLYKANYNLGIRYAH